MNSKIKSRSIEKLFGNHIDYIEYDCENGSITDDTMITIVFKPEYRRQEERMLLKDLIFRTVRHIHGIRGE